MRGSNASTIGGSETQLSLISPEQVADAEAEIVDHSKRIEFLSH
jgi:hypothetical protein